MIPKKLNRFLNKSAAKNHGPMPINRQRHRWKIFRCCSTFLKKEKQPKKNWISSTRSCRRLWTISNSGICCRGKKTDYRLFCKLLPVQEERKVVTGRRC